MIYIRTKQNNEMALKLGNGRETRSALRRTRIDSAERSRKKEC